MRTAQEAIAWLAQQAGETGWRGRALALTRTAVDSEPGWPSAQVMWDGHPDGRHADRDYPPGAVLFWSGSVYGYCALNAGDGDMWGVDGAGEVARMSTSDPERLWGYTYLGWLTF